MPTYHLTIDHTFDADDITAARRQALHYVDDLNFNQFEVTPPERTWTFTISANFTAPTQDEAWADWFQWLDQPSVVEDGTEVTELLPDTLAVIEQAHAQHVAELQLILDADEAADDWDGLGNYDGPPINLDEDGPEVEPPQWCNSADDTVGPGTGPNHTIR